MTFSGHSPGTPTYRRLIVGLFFAGVATFAQLYSPQAVLPQLAADLDVSAATAALSVSAATLGLACAVIPWSLAADRLGRVPAMAVGVLTATAFGIVAPFSVGLEMLLVLRLLEGVALGAVPAVALAYLSEEVSARSAAAAAGSYIAGTTVGGLSGRILSGIAGDIGDWRVGLWAVAGLCAVSAVLFLWLVPAAQGFVPHGRRAIDRPAALTRLLAPLRSGRQLALYAQGFLLMGAFVAVYNYLGFHLTAPPFALPVWLVTLLFLAYLAGTVSSPLAGGIATRVGRFPVLLGSIVVMAAGAAAMFIPAIPALLLGLLVFTAGFFGAHAIASGWVPVLAGAESRAQASSLYYFGYYGGSSLFGWLLGVVFVAADWSWFVAAIIALCALAAVAAVGGLRHESA